MQPSSMQEHGGEQRQDSCQQPCGSPVVGIDVKRRYNPKDVEERGERPAQREFVNKHQTVEHNQNDRDKRKGSRGRN